MFRSSLLGLLLVLPLGSCKGSKESEIPGAQRSEVVQIATGTSFTCALLANGGVRCWGRGFDGSLDDHPPRAIDIGAPAARLTAGTSHACVLTRAGNVRCWGLGRWGRLGYANTQSLADPAEAGDVDLGGAKATKVAAGHAATCAILEGGAIRCWGSGQGGRLGTGKRADLGDDEPPAAAPPIELPEPIEDLAVGAAGVMCAVGTSGKLWCWGQDRQGEVGHPLEEVDDERLWIPGDLGPVETGAPVRQVSIGTAHTCVLRHSQDVQCWGSAGSGRLGYADALTPHPEPEPGPETLSAGPAAREMIPQADPSAAIGDDEVPAEAGPVDLGGKASQVGVGRAHTCVLLETGSVRCWGSNTKGQLGYGNIDFVGLENTPAEVGDVPLGGRAKQLSVAGDRTCVLMEDGAVRCWGAGRSDRGLGGHLGYDRPDDIGDDETPADVGDVPLW